MLLDNTSAQLKLKKNLRRKRVRKERFLFSMPFFQKKIGIFRENWEIILEEHGYFWGEGNILR